MSRFDGAGYNVLDVEDWVVNDPDRIGGFKIVDPIDGLDIDRFTVPAFLKENPGLALGEHVLRSTGATSLHIMYTKGELEYDDLTPVDPDTKPIEEVLDPQNGPDAVIHTIDGVILGDYGMRWPARPYNAYGQRIEATAMAADTAVLCAGLEVDEHCEPVSHTELAIKEIFAKANAIRADRTINPATKDAITSVARSVAQSYRLLSMGREVHTYNQLLDNGFSLGYAALAAPVADAGYTHKLEGMGWQFIREGAVDPDSYMPDEQRQTGLMFDGRFWLTQ